MNAMPITHVGPGTIFYHHLNKYIVCTNKQINKHPARGMEGVLAYHIQDSGPIVPVRFNPSCEVFV